MSPSQNLPAPEHNRQSILHHATHVPSTRPWNFQKLTRLQAEFRKTPDDQILANIDGRARFGKSYVLKIISAHLQQRDSTKPSPIKRVAATGVAAHLIKGQTMHSMFDLPYSGYPANTYIPLEILH